MSDIDKSDSFVQRLWTLTEGRAKHGWGNAAGLTHSAVNRMFQGHTPSAESLTAISLTGRVNVDWLLTGVGRPYRVRRVAYPEAGMIIDEWRRRSPVELYALVVGKFVGTVSMAPAKHTVGSRAIEFSAVTVIDWRDATPGNLNELAKYLDGQGVAHLDCDESEAEDLMMGQMGNVKLLEMIARTKHAGPWRVMELSERSPAYARGDIYSDQEVALVKNYRSLPQSDRGLLESLAERLLHGAAQDL